MGANQLCREWSVPHVCKVVETHSLSRMSSSSPPLKFLHYDISWGLHNNNKQMNNLTVENHLSLLEHVPGQMLLLLLFG